MNDGIDKHAYMGEQIEFKYPTVDSLARHLHEMKASDNREMWLYKEDLDRAFRQLWTDPGSIPLQGFKWRSKYYFDLVLVMGCQIAPYICQRVTNMIAYVQALMGYFLLNYADDLIRAEYQDAVEKAHKALKNLLRDIGIEQSLKKSVPPTQVIEFTGNLFNTIDFTIGITPQRKISIMRELECWHHKRFCTCKQLESLIGKLQFLNNCVKPGRVFVSRLLNALKGMDRSRWYEVSEQMRQDIRWWYLFVPGFKGTCVMWLLDTVVIDQEMAMDTCMRAAGGVCGNEIFKTKFPPWICEDKSHKIHIAHLELWSVIIAVKLGGEKLKGKIVRIRTDNESVANVINSRRANDIMLQKQLRELLWWSSIYQCKILVVHLMGRLNKLPDLLSRYFNGDAARREYHAFTHDMQLVEHAVPVSLFKFMHKW